MNMKKGSIAELYMRVLKEVGALSAEPEFMDLENTPMRVERMLRDELLSSYRPGALKELKRKFTMFPAPTGKKSAMVVEQGIAFSSMCGHHMLPFSGVAHVGYVPRQKVAGLSKIPRAVDFFSNKLQIQERLVVEIADFLVEMLDPVAVIVYMEARHSCMEVRGVRKSNVLTKTSAIRPVKMDASIKNEFYSVIGVRS